VEVKCRWVVKLEERIGELVELKLEIGNFGRCRWVVPPFGMVSTDNWWWARVVGFLLEMAWKNNL
jgi:hypothetical protein